MATRHRRKRVDHLIAIKAFTRQSLPMPMPRGTSLELVVKDLLEKWEGERAGYLNIPSSLTYATLLECSHQPKGIFPAIVEHPAIMQSFAWYPSLFGTLQIRDKRGVVLGYRFKIPPHLLTTLNATSKTLDSDGPHVASGGEDPLAQGRHTNRRYDVSADFSKKYVESQALLRDGEKGRDWLRENRELFDYCSNQLRFLCPEQYVKMTGNVVKDMAKAVSADGRKLRPLGGAWHGVSLSQGSNPNASRPSQHWMNDKRLLNCVVPFGDGFQGGELVLWQMNMRIGLEIGEGFFFYGSLVAHQVMEVTAGVRNSIELFTRESNCRLLAKHRKAAGRVQYPPKERTVRAQKRREERRKENAVARREIREGKKLRQRAAGLIKDRRGGSRG